MSCYREPDSHIRDKFKVLLDFSNYATKKELENATSVDTSNLATRSDFIALKTGVNKLDISKLVNVATDLNNSNKSKWFRCC